VFLATLLALMAFHPAPARASSEQDTMTGHDGMSHDGMSMSMDTPIDPKVQAKLLADKRESEFNHHLAGFLVLLGGIVLLAEGELRQRWPSLRFVWPATLLLAGLFLLVWSDTELWPFGPQSWWHTLVTNREVLQHKTYAVILLVLGVIELQKIRERLKAVWASWAFPVLAVAGSVLLLFHMHRAGMHGAHHMEIMERVQSEHISYSIAGFSIGLSKGLSETHSSWQAFFQRLWPALLMVLGALLMMYVE
jgi:putative copper resistance protein D